MTDARHEPLRSASLMVGARLLNLGMGLLTIPLLIRYLGGEGFAAWAILLAIAAGFSLLDLGMIPATISRFAAVPARDGDWNAMRVLFTRVWILLALSFGCGLVAIRWLAPPMAAWLGLPDTPLFAAGEIVVGVYLAVAIRAFSQCGTLALFAARRFAAVSLVSLLQPLCANVAAIVTACLSGRLDLALIAFWSAQLGVVGITFFVARRMCAPRFARGALDFGKLRELCFYGLTNQTEGWAQFVNFQFDKFIIAGLVGLWGVAPYEVANRAAAALRSIPVSGAETLLPSAVIQQARNEDPWGWYTASTRIAAYGVLLFMIAPLAVSPVFLYAWTGEMGYLGRGVFVPLIIGATASVLSLPAAMLMQAAGRPGIQARAALIAIAINVPLSLALLAKWELVGAATGTGVAMVAGASFVVVATHRHFDRPLRSTAALLARFWPLLLACACWGGLSWLVFREWFATLDAALRFSRATRVYPGLAAIAVYLLCVTSMVAIEVRRGALSSAERAFLSRLKTSRWFAARR